MTTPKILSAIGAASLACALGTYLSAHGGNTALIHGCADNKNGALRIIAAASSCKNGESPLDWNIAGVQGPPGTTGTPGGIGPQGPPGEGSLRVVDSLGVEVGPLGPRSGVIANTHDTVLVEVSGGRWVAVAVGFDGFILQLPPGGFRLNYETSDCTGQAYGAYSFKTSRSFLGDGYVENGVVYYALPSDGVPHSFQSRRDLGSATCEPQDSFGAMATVHTHALSDYGVPFSVVR